MGLFYWSVTFKYTHHSYELLITLFTMGNIYRFLKCQFYFSYYNATYSCILEKNSKISENIEKMMNIFPLVNSC